MKKKKSWGLAQNLKGSLRGIAKTSAMNAPKFQEVQLKNLKPQQKPIIRRRLPFEADDSRPGLPFNFFAHASEEEVYGDSGLTLLDTRKRRRGTTGSLFGI